MKIFLSTFFSLLLLNNVYSQTTKSEEQIRKEVIFEGPEPKFISINNNSNVKRIVFNGPETMVISNHEIQSEILGIKERPRFNSPEPKTIKLNND